MSTAYDRTRVKYIVLHHLGDGLPAANTEEELRRRANPPHDGYPNGYEYPEYDYGILADGNLISMRPLTVIGAHAQPDLPGYRWGENWWNRNSASVVIGIDATLFRPPGPMVSSLINCLANFCQEQGSEISNIYPHFQISNTKCPGASYTKLGLNTGFLDYDSVESSVDLILKGDLVQVLNQAVVVFGIWDLIPAYKLAIKLRCPVIPRGISWRIFGFNQFYIVGGPPEAGPGIVNLTGDTWEDTAQAVLEELKKHG